MAVLEGTVCIESVAPTRMEPCEKVEGRGLRWMLHVMSVSKNWEVLRVLERTRQKKPAFSILRQWLWFWVIIPVSCRSGLRGSSPALLFAALLE